jgi:hypothetical protein
MGAQRGGHRGRHPWGQPRIGGVTVAPSTWIGSRTLGTPGRKRQFIQAFLRLFNTSPRSVDAVLCLSTHSERFGPLPIYPLPGYGSTARQAVLRGHDIASDVGGP